MVSDHGTAAGELRRARSAPARERGSCRRCPRRGASSAALLALSLLAAACAGTPPGGQASGPAATSPSGGERMRRILSSPPDLSWEASPLLPPGDYWHVPGDGANPGFFLSRNGFHYAEPENYALSYERAPAGFTLVEVKKRAGERPLAQCPVFIPLEDCIEQHSLMLATLLSCASGSSCTYRFIVYDAYSPFQILRRDHALASLKKQLADGWSPPPDIDVKFEESGVVFDTDEAWAGYIADRFAFIAAQVRGAQMPDGFRFSSTLAW